MDSIAEEILRDTFLKLQTRDVARCRCVCSQWRRLLADPSFLTLHAHSAHIVSGTGAAEALLVSKSGAHAPGRNPDIVLFNLSSSMPMCRLADLDPEVYSPANACNGFLCLVSDNLQDAAVIVCNPITGEKIEVLAPPPPPIVESISWQLFVMGFSSSSSSTYQYKLFRLSFPEMYTEDVYLDVYIFGDNNAGWQRRRRPDLSFGRHETRSWPLLIDGMLYVVTLSFFDDS